MLIAAWPGCLLDKCQ